MVHLNNCSTTAPNTLTRNPISAESTTLPLLIGIKQRYPSICPIRLLVASSSQSFRKPRRITDNLRGTAYTRRASVVKLSNFTRQKVPWVRRACLEYDEPHNRPRPTFFHGPFQDRRRWKGLMYYATSQPAPNIGYIQRKRHHLLVDFVRPSTQTTSMLLRHMFKSLITLQCGSSLLCWFDQGVHSTPHGLTLFVDLFIRNSAAYLHK
ncbi:hypothetical protein V8E52_008693 [Russula decolorans]